MIKLSAVLTLAMISAANAQFLQAPAPISTPQAVVQDTVKNLAEPAYQPVEVGQPVEDGGYIPKNLTTEMTTEAPMQAPIAQPSAGIATGGEIIDLRPAPTAPFAYLSGGIGADEVANMQVQKANYNFHIMSADKTGHFTGEIAITISDASGATLFASDGGPLFYATLPNGKYNVTGERDGIVKSQKINIMQGKPTHIHFGW